MSEIILIYILLVFIRKDCTIHKKKAQLKEKIFNILLVYGSETK